MISLCIWHEKESHWTIHMNDESGARILPRTQEYVINCLNSSCCLLAQNKRNKILIVTYKAIWRFLPASVVRFANLPLDPLFSHPCLYFPSAFLLPKIVHTPVHFFYDTLLSVKICFSLQNGKILCIFQTQEDYHIIPESLSISSVLGRMKGEGRWEKLGKANDSDFS